MRRCLDTIAIDGTIVIGEGERDEAPMLYIGEKVGARNHNGAIDGGYRGRSAGRHQSVRHRRRRARSRCWRRPSTAACCTRPTATWKRSWSGPAAKGAVDLDAPVKQNLKAIARRLQRGVDDLVVVVLDRPRHQKLIADIREAGARIRLISDGDLSAGIAAAVAGTGVHAVMGSGGAPEGVLTRRGAALPERRDSGPAGGEGRRAEGADAGDGHPGRRPDLHDAANWRPGTHLVFAACGVTDGNLLQGVRFTGDGMHTQSVVMTSTPARVRFIDTTHLENKPDVKVRFR